MKKKRSDESGERLAAGLAQWERIEKRLADESQKLREDTARRRQPTEGPMER